MRPAYGRGRHCRRGHKDAETDMATMVSVPPNAVEPLDKREGKALAKLALAPSPPAPASTPPAPPIMLGPRIAPSPAAVPNLLRRRAATELPLRPPRWALLGKYDGYFRGDELMNGLPANVVALDCSWDKTEDAARVFTVGEGLLCRIGDFGNAFESADNAFYQLRPQVWPAARSRVADPARAPARPRTGRHPALAEQVHDACPRARGMSRARGPSPARHDSYGRGYWSDVCLEACLFLGSYRVLWAVVYLDGQDVCLVRLV
jgi:hypothetical protein